MCLEKWHSTPWSGVARAQTSLHTTSHTPPPCPTWMPVFLWLLLYDYSQRTSVSLYSHLVKKEKVLQVTRCWNHAPLFTLSASWVIIIAKRRELKELYKLTLDGSIIHHTFWESCECILPMKSALFLWSWDEQTVAVFCLSAELSGLFWKHLISSRFKKSDTRRRGPEFLEKRRRWFAQ